jgi:hypothetical protein
MSAFIQCVSMPRAGHHLLIRLLKYYYQGDNNCSEKFYYCGHYKACKTHPCSCRKKGIRRFRKNRPKPLITVQKSHDRNMLFPGSSELKHWEAATDDPELKVNLDYDHIIQIRDPIMSIVSDYRLCLGKFTAIDKWLHYAKIGMLYRKAFLEKWIIYNKYIETKRYHVVYYDDMVNDQVEELKKIIKYITPEHAIDANAVKSAFDQHPVKTKWSIDSFVFYETVSELETMICSTWERAKSITKKVAHGKNSQ